MIKKLVIILPVLVIIIGCVAYYIFQQNSKQPVDSNAGNKSIYIEKGAEKYAKIAKPAVESYATQDVSEPLTSRSKRLTENFTSDSPIFSRDIEIRSNNSAIKTKAKVTSVSFPTGEGQYQTIIVKADITSYAGSNGNTVSQTYWVTMKDSSNGLLKAYDIGLMNQ